MAGFGCDFNSQPPIIIFLDPPLQSTHAHDCPDLSGNFAVTRPFWTFHDICQLKHRVKHSNLTLLRLSNQPENRCKMYSSFPRFYLQHNIKKVDVTFWQNRWCNLLAAYATSFFTHAFHYATLIGQTWHLLYECRCKILENRCTEVFRLVDWRELWVTCAQLPNNFYQSLFDVCP